MAAVATAALLAGGKKTDKTGSARGNKSIIQFRVEYLSSI